MKYTVNSELKVITFEGLITCVEVKELCDKYPDYSFQLRGIPEKVFAPFIQRLPLSGEYIQYPSVTTSATTNMVSIKN